jgi:hypothetical protein
VTRLRRLHATPTKPANPAPNSHDAAGSGTGGVSNWPDAEVKVTPVGTVMMKGSV